MRRLEDPQMNARHSRRGVETPEENDERRQERAEHFGLPPTATWEEIGEARETRLLRRAAEMAGLPPTATRADLIRGSYIRRGEVASEETVAAVIVRTKDRSYDTLLPEKRRLADAIQEQYADIRLALQEAAALITQLKTFRVEAKPVSGQVGEIGRQQLLDQMPASLLQILERARLVEVDIRKRIEELSWQLSEAVGRNPRIAGGQESDSGRGEPMLFQVFGFQVADYRRDPTGFRAALKQKFRELAKTNHPDLHPGDVESLARMKSVTEANEVLSDDIKLERYLVQWTMGRKA